MEGALVNRTISLTIPLALASTLVAAPAPASTPVEAVWTSHEMTLGYQGLTTDYSCQGLRQKVKSLLLYFGARTEGLKVSAYGCAGGPYRPVPAVNLSLRFETLAPAEPGATDTVPAKWVERDLFPRKKVQQEAPQYVTRGDCEIVQRFTALVLPAFTHETLQDLTNCIPHRLDGTIPNLREKVLVPADTQDPPR
jgi:hypothetical protein